MDDFVITEAYEIDAQVLVLSRPHLFPFSNYHVIRSRQSVLLCVPKVYIHNFAV